MPFEPRKREPRVHLDRWVILADKIADGEKWIKANFMVPRMQRFIGAGSNKSAWLIVKPIFDPTDPIEVMIFTSGSLYGVNFYGYVDIRSKLQVLHDSVLEKSLLSEVQRSVRIHPEGLRSQHPHPEPPWNQEENNRETYLCRRWLAPEPFDVMGDSVQENMPEFLQLRAKQ